jgi:hypothetical protein
MDIEVAIAVNGSLESVCRRAALFSRMIDEHDPASLRVKDAVHCLDVRG